MTTNKTMLEYIEGTGGNAINETVLLTGITGALSLEDIRRTYGENSYRAYRACGMYYYYSICTDGNDMLVLKFGDTDVNLVVGRRYSRPFFDAITTRLADCGEFLKTLPKEFGKEKTTIYL